VKATLIALLIVLVGSSCSNKKPAHSEGAGASAASGGTSGRGASGGAGGTAGKATGGGGNTAPPTSSHSVLERNNCPSRDGHFVEPTLTKTMAAKLAMDADFQASFTGKMYASPLYLENGPAGKGIFIAVTTNNDVLALDESSGKTVWTRSIGQAASATGAGCGNVSPLGILSTPVIDASSRTIYVAGAVGSNAIERHEVHALSADDGKERSGFPIDVASIAAKGTVAFQARTQNQRSALALVGHTLYVPYGGHFGDCGDYRAWVFGIDVSDPSKRGGWVGLGRGEGIWAAGGTASDGNGVFAITGNNTALTANHADTDSEEVVRITGLGELERNDANIFYPARWRTMDDADADFGASSPVYIEVPGATPSKIVVAIAKDGHLYLLDAANLGGMGGQKADFTVSNGSMTLLTVPAAYTTAKGVHVVFSVRSGSANCPAGQPNGHVMMSVLIPKGAPPAPSIAWCAAASGADTAPMVTTTDGNSDALVWYMNDGKLKAVDGDTGAVVFDGGSDSCSGVRQWTAPIAVKGRIVVGGDGHLCSWSAP